MNSSFPFSLLGHIQLIARMQTANNRSCSRRPCFCRVSQLLGPEMFTQSHIHSLINNHWRSKLNNPYICHAAPVLHSWAALLGDLFSQFSLPTSSAHTGLCKFKGPVHGESRVTQWIYHLLLVSRTSFMELYNL